MSQVIQPIPLGKDGFLPPKAIEQLVIVICSCDR